MPKADKPKTLVDVREHVLYCGVTMTGKTTLARFHARILERAGHDVAVYDPVGTETAGGGWPEKARIITEPEEFAKESDGWAGDEEKPLFIFVDESADVFGHSETWSHWIPRRIRHRDVYLRLIVQRPHMLHPSVRSQCAFAYVMRLSNQDMRLILSDFGHSQDDIPEAFSEGLDKGDCLILESGRASIESFNVFALVDRRTRSTTPKGTSS